MGGWWCADGSKWFKVRNEKRKRDGEAKMTAWKEEIARRKAAREEAGKENLHYLIRDEYSIEARLRRQAELDDRIDAIVHDGRKIYCEHLREVGMLEDAGGFQKGKYEQTDFEEKLLTGGSCCSCERLAGEFVMSRYQPCLPSPLRLPRLPSVRFAHN